MRLATIQLLVTLGVQALTIGRSLPDPQDAKHVEKSTPAARSDIFIRGTDDKIKLSELVVETAAFARGQDGELFKAKKKSNPLTTYAFKRYKNLAALPIEIAAYKKIDDEGIAPKFEAVVVSDQNGKDLGILMEYIKDAKNSEPNNKEHAQGAAKNLEIAHDKNLLHGDIDATGNILVTESWGRTKVYLVDWARSRESKDDGDKMVELSKMKEHKFKGVKWDKDDDYKVKDD